MNTNSFNETQKFRQWWLVIILLLPTGLIAYGVIQQLVFRMPFGDKPASDMLLVGILLFMILLDFLLLSVRLETRIDYAGVHYRWRPLMSKDRSIPWENIQHAEVIRYRFVGYGWRFSFRYGRVYNVSGNEGLQLVLKNGSKLLIGTQQAEAVREILRQFTT